MGLFGHFALIYPFSSLSPSLWETTRYRLKYCLRGSLSPKTTNQQLGHAETEEKGRFLGVIITILHPHTNLLVAPSDISVHGYDSLLVMQKLA